MKITDLTIQQKIDILKKTLSWFENWKPSEYNSYLSGVCSQIICNLPDDFEFDNTDCSYAEIIQINFDMLKYKPKEIEGMWWWNCNKTGLQPRIDLLHKLIKDWEVKL